MHTLAQPVRTGRTHCAQAARAGRSVVACNAPCRALYRRATARVAVCRVAAPAPCREPVSRYNLAAKPRALSRPTRPPPQPRYKSLYRNPAPSRARARPYRSLPLDRVVALFGRVVAQFNRIVAEPAWPCAPWVTIQSTVS